MLVYYSTPPTRIPRTTSQTSPFPPIWRPEQSHLSAPLCPGIVGVYPRPRRLPQRSSGRTIPQSPAERARYRER